MYRRKMITGVFAWMMAVVCMACGNGSPTVESVETAISTETGSDEESAGAEEGGNTEAQEEPADAETEAAVTAETQAAVEQEEAAEEENQDNNKGTLRGEELEKIVQQYDEVLSDYDLKCYFGYNKPDDGWESWYDVDGRQEGKREGEIHKGDETLYIKSFETEPVRVVSVFNEDGNEVEVQADEYEYQCRYNDAIRVFCKTGEWEEPERCQKPYHAGIDYCIDRRHQGKIDTPYGEGILYSAVYEYIGYAEHNDEGAYWEQIDESYCNWRRGEGVIMEIDKYFIQIELSADDWYVLDWKEGNGGDSLVDIVYSKRLEELLPQMFEVK